MNNYTVIPNGLILKSFPTFDSNTLPSREFRIHTGPEGARQLEQALRAELGRQLTHSELIQQLDNLSREENV